MGGSLRCQDASCVQDILVIENLARMVSLTDTFDLASGCVCFRREDGGILVICFRGRKEGRFGRVMSPRERRMALDVVAFDELDTLIFLETHSEYIYARIGSNKYRKVVRTSYLSTN